MRSDAAVAPVALTGATAHVLLAFRHPGGGWALLLLAMAAVCVPCAVHLWLGAAGRAGWTTTALLSAGMVTAHLGMATGHVHGPGDRVLFAVATTAAVATALAAGVRAASFRSAGERLGEV